MRSSIAAILILSAVLTAAADDASLHWNNGDSLSGTLLKADETSLTWKSPMFTDPLQIQLSYLASVNFLAGAAPESDEPASRIQMCNGDVLTGRLRSMRKTGASIPVAQEFTLIRGPRLLTPMPCVRRSRRLP